MTVAELIAVIALIIALFTLGGFLRYITLMNKAWKNQQKLNTETMRWVENITQTVENLTNLNTGKRREKKH